MRNLRTGLVAVGLWMMVIVPTANAVVTKTATGHRVSVMARAGAPVSSTFSPSSAGGVLQSHGGPVLSASAPYLIYWAPGQHAISSASESLMNRYLTDVASASNAGSTTNVYSVLGQYGSPYRQTFDPTTQAVIDTDPYPVKQTGCNVATGTTACVTDGSLQAEISHLIDTGQVPAPGDPGSGATPIFFVVTPVDVNVCLGGNTCASNNFCAYHDFFTHNGHDVLYSSVPFSVFATSPKGCQTDQYTNYETPVGSGGDQAYNIADDLSHELSETITDPLINAWYSSHGFEIGDLCEAYAPTADTSRGVSPLAYAPATGDPSTGKLYDQVISRDRYYNQTEFSNSDNKCLTGLTRY